MRTKVWQKLWFGLSAAALAGAPLATVVACGESSDVAAKPWAQVTATQVAKTRELVNFAPLFDLAYFPELNTTTNQTEYVTADAHYDKLIAAEKAGQNDSAKIANYEAAKALGMAIANHQLRPEQLTSPSFQLALAQQAFTTAAALGVAQETAKNITFTTKQQSVVDQFAKILLEVSSAFAQHRDFAQRFSAFALQSARTSLVLTSAEYTDFLKEIYYYGQPMLKFLLVQQLIASVDDPAALTYTAARLTALAKYLSLAPAVFAPLKSTLLAPVVTRIGYGANYGQDIPDGTLTAVQQSTIAKLKVLAIDSNSATEATLPAGLYQRPITNASQPLAAPTTMFQINFMPAGGQPVVFGDTEIEITSARLGEKRKFVFWKVDSKTSEFTFLPRATYDAMTLKTRQAADALNVEALKTPDLGLAVVNFSNLYTAKDSAVTKPVSPRAGTSVQIETAPGVFTTFDQIAETKLIAADPTKTYDLYRFGFDEAGAVTRALRNLIDELAAALLTN